MCECHCLMKCSNVTDPQRAFWRGGGNLLHRNFPLSEESEAVLGSICYTHTGVFSHARHWNPFEFDYGTPSIGGGLVIYFFFFSRNDTLPLGMRTKMDILTFCESLQANLCVSRGYKPSLEQKLHMRLTDVSDRTR